MTRHKRNIIIFFIGGLATILPGAFLGLLIGASVGGTLTPVIDIPEIYAGLRGYEGTGVLGLVLGPSLLLLGWIRARLNGRLRRDAYIILSITTIIHVVIQNFIWTQPEWKLALFLLLFLPIVAQVLLLVFHNQDEF